MDSNYPVITKECGEAQHNTEPPQILLHHKILLHRRLKLFWDQPVQLRHSMEALFPPRLLNWCHQVYQRPLQRVAIITKLLGPIISLIIIYYIGPIITTPPIITSGKPIISLIIIYYIGPIITTPPIITSGKISSPQSSRAK